MFGSGFVGALCLCLPFGRAFSQLPPPNMKKPMATVVREQDVADVLDPHLFDV